MDLFHLTENEVFYFTIYAVNYFISSKARYFTKTIFKKLDITAFLSKSYKNIRTILNLGNLAGF